MPAAAWHGEARTPTRKITTICLEALSLVGVNTALGTITAGLLCARALVLLRAPAPAPATPPPPPPSHHHHVWGRAEWGWPSHGRVPPGEGWSKPVWWWHGSWCSEHVGVVERGKELCGSTCSGSPLGWEHLHVVGGHSTTNHFGLL